MKIIKFPLIAIPIFLFATIAYSECVCWNGQDEEYAVLFCASVETNGAFGFILPVSDRPKVAFYDGRVPQYTRTFQPWKYIIVNEGAIAFQVVLTHFGGLYAGFTFIDAILAGRTIEFWWSGFGNGRNARHYLRDCQNLESVVYFKSLVAEYRQ